MAGTKEAFASAGDKQPRVRSLGGQDLLEKEIASDSCLGNTMVRGACWASVYRVAKESGVTARAPRRAYEQRQNGQQAPRAVRRAASRSES